MSAISAVDCISPAFRLTHSLLLHPFRIGRSWKLAATQYLGLMGAFFVPLPLFLAFLPMPLATDHHLRLVLYSVITLVMLIFLAIFYLGIRLQFVNLEMIITRQVTIAPIWRRYSAKVWPVAGLKIAIGTILYLVVLPLLWRRSQQLFSFTQALPNQPGQPPDPKLLFEFFSHIAGIYALILFAFLIFKSVSTLFEDFALPFYTLEPIPLFTAIRRGIRILVAEPLQCLAYLGLKFLLSIAGFMAQYVANLLILIPFFFIIAIAVGIGMGVNAFTHGIGNTGSAIGVILGGILYFVLIVVMFWFQIGTFGYIFTVLEAYSVLFLAGRYPLLATLLQPTRTPPPPHPRLT